MGCMLAWVYVIVMWVVVTASYIVAGFRWENSNVHTCHRQSKLLVVVLTGVVIFDRKRHSF